MLWRSGNERVYHCSTVAIYLTGDGEKRIVPMPQLTIAKGDLLERIQDLVVLQIAVVEAGKTGRDRNDEVRRFRFGWYGAGSLNAALSRVPPASVTKHLLLAVQEELCDREELRILEAGAIASFLQLGLHDIRRGEPGSRLFIIHGRDEETAHKLAAFVQGKGFDPLILADLSGRAEVIIEMLERYLPEADIIVALFTPDDEGKLRGSGDALQPRARQNVLVEAGYALIHRRQDSIIIRIGDTEIPSDLGGIRTIKAQKWDYGVERRLLDALRS